ncbi:hypothetical protein D3C78_1603780 [compost metagenome]
MLAAMPSPISAVAMRVALTSAKWLPPTDSMIASFIARAGKRTSGFFRKALVGDS